MRHCAPIVYLVVLLCSGCASGVTRPDGAAASHRLAADQKVTSATLTVTQGVKASLDDNIKFNPDMLLDMINRRLELNGIKADKAPLSLDIVIKDVRVRSTAAAIVFGFMAGDDRIVGDVYLKDSSGRILDRFEVSASYALGGWAGGQDGMRMSWLYEEFSKVLVSELKSGAVASANQAPTPVTSAAAAPRPSAPAGPRTPVTGNDLADLFRGLGKVTTGAASQVRSMDFQPGGTVVVDFADGTRRGSYRVSPGDSRLCMTFSFGNEVMARTSTYLSDCFSVYRLDDGWFVMRAVNSVFEVHYRQPGTLAVDEPKTGS